MNKKDKLEYLIKELSGQENVEFLMGLAKRLLEQSRNTDEDSTS